MRLIILPFANGSGETNLDHWQYTIPFLLKSQLRNASELTVLPDKWLEFGADESAAFAYRRVQPPTHLTPETVRRLGNVVGADVVLWGQYALDGNRCRLSVRVSNVHTRDASSPLKSEAPRWFETICLARDAVLKSLGIKPTRETIQKMNRSPTPSDGALEFFSRAFAGRSVGAPLISIETNLRRALLEDPHFVLGQDFLALVLLANDNPKAALALAESAVKGQPDSPTAHYIMGSIYSYEGQDQLAIGHFQRALDFAPNEPLTLLGMAEVFLDQDSESNALAMLQKAEQLDPQNARIHLDLGLSDWRAGHAVNALAQLRVAKTLDNGNEGDVLLSLAQLSANLNQTGDAIDYYTRFLAGAGRVGLQNQDVVDAKQALLNLQRRLQPEFIHATAPRNFSDTELKKSVDARLTGEEIQNVINPFTATPSMTNWALRRVTGASNDLAKARSLFLAIAPHCTSTGSPELRTAEQAFKAWQNPDSFLSCQDYTFLYVVLARAVGLNAFYVDVTRDCRSNLVNHCCAGLFIGSRALLVDIAYQLFGAVHADYSFLNDLQATAMFLAQSTNSQERLMAVKLDPTSSSSQFFLACTLADAGKTNEARAALAAALRLDPASWSSFFARGIVALNEQNPRAATKDMEQCLEIWPSQPVAHYFLAKASQMLREPEKACAEYRAYIQEGTDPKMISDAKKQLDSINTYMTWVKAKMVRSDIVTNAPASKPIGTLRGPVTGVTH